LERFNEICKSKKRRLAHQMTIPEFRATLAWMERERAQAQQVPSVSDAASNSKPPDAAV
jgi:hypothetical protein